MFLSMFFNSRFSWDMLCLLVNFYPCAPNALFHIPPEKKSKSAVFFMFSGGLIGEIVRWWVKQMKLKQTKKKKKNVILLKAFKENNSVFTNKISTQSVLILLKITIFLANSKM